MKVKISKKFLTWYVSTNPHLIENEITQTELSKELEEYVNDVLEEHMESMNELLDVDDDSPDSGFIEE